MTRPGFWQFLADDSDVEEPAKQLHPDHGMHHDGQGGLQGWVGLHWI